MANPKTLNATQIMLIATIDQSSRFDKYNLLVKMKKCVEWRMNLTIKGTKSINPLQVTQSILNVHYDK